MKNKIYPCIWLDHQAEEAARFYCSLFTNGAILAQSPIVVTVGLSGQKFMLLNGGPMFKPNPTMSFYVICETENEIEDLWKKLVKNGIVMMPLGKYDWSQKYGWLEDQYGVCWQITLGKIADIGQKITPALMFVGDQFGRGDEALQLYTSVFNDSDVQMIHRYDESDPLQKGKISHSQFSLLGQKFILMDSGMAHAFSFSEGLSLVIDCDDQKEINYYWSKLTEGGEESQCGWLKDTFGFSWQIVPTILAKLMSDPAKAPGVTKAFLQMKKFDIEKLLQA